MDFYDIFYLEESSVLGAGDMSLHVVIKEGPSKEISAHTDGIKSMNSCSNVYKKLKKTSCKYFEESVPEPSRVQFFIAATATTTQSYYGSVRHYHSVMYFFSVRYYRSVRYYHTVRYYHSVKCYRRPPIRLCIPPFTLSYMNISATKQPIVTKFYLKPHWDGDKVH